MKHSRITPIVSHSLLFFLIFTGIAAHRCRAEEGYSLDRLVKKEDLPLLFREGKILLNARARYEFANQDGRKDSNAFTLRTRLGLQTGTVKGFSAMVELEDVRVIGPESNFNPFPRAGRTVIADPEGTELNRAQFSFHGFDSTLIAGRQRIKLDKDRFIGNVGWRQHEQTFDALTFKNASLPDLEFHYGYIRQVNRIFSDDAPLLGQREFDSDSHLLHALYTGWKAAKITVYAYLLDFANSPANSSDTFGLSFDGLTPFNDNLKVKWHAEYARQKDGGDNPNDYTANYFHFNAVGLYKGFSFGGGYELLASDNGQGFRTPLATLHAFNGWADSFLNTPGSGLEDIYLLAGLPRARGIPLKLVYHWFNSDVEDIDYGREFDAVLSRKFGNHWTVLAKFALFQGEDAFADRQKFWLQTEFKF